MAGGKSGADAQRSETEITLGVLDAIQDNEAVTQRSMASELGIALGLANAYFKRCIRKGWIKVNQIPPNRYAYYLTPTGFAEKSRLTAEYLSSSFTFFRRVRKHCEDALAVCKEKGWQRVALVGRSELTEIAALCNVEYKLDLVVVDEAGDASSVAGLPAVRSVEEAGELDAAIVTDFSRSQEVYDSLADRFGDSRVLTPEMLKVRRRPQTDGARSSGN